MLIKTHFRKVNTLQNRYCLKTQQNSAFDTYGWPRCDTGSMRLEQLARATFVLVPVRNDLSLGCPHKVGGHNYGYNYGPEKVFRLFGGHPI